MAENIASLPAGVMNDDVLTSPSFETEFIAHLQRNSDLHVTHLTRLDQDVFRVDRRQEISWIARLFPLRPPCDAMKADAAILNYLHEHHFPVERLAHSEPISEFQESQVLLTEFVLGDKPPGSQQLYRKLGDLLGQLHSLPFDNGPLSRKGGAWHHLCYPGGIEEEISAAQALLSDAKRQVAEEDADSVNVLKKHLDVARQLERLPFAFNHPNFVPANIIQSSTGDLTVINWTGAGRGPRLAALGFLFWIAGNQSLKYIDDVIKGYCPHVHLDVEELQLLSNAIKLRPLVLSIWEFGRGRKTLGEIVKRVNTSDRLAEKLAQHARRILSDQGDSQMRARDDPPSGVGETGLAVAAIRGEESRRLDRLFNDEFAHAFVATANWTSKRSKNDSRLRALKVWIVARTVFLDNLILDACRSGCQQVVILGAGFDARAFRLAWPLNVRCFEIDTPQVLDFKSEVITQQRAFPKCDRTPISCDLRNDWADALLKAGFDPVQKSVWLAEGLVMYLEPDQVDRLLTTISSLAAPGSRFGADMSTRTPGMKEERDYTNLRRSSAPEDPVSWLLTYGWTAQLSSPREILQARGRVSSEVSKDAIKPEKTHKSFLLGAVKK